MHKTVIALAPRHSAANPSLMAVDSCEDVILAMAPALWGDVDGIGWPDLFAMRVSCAVAE